MNLTENEIAILRNLIRIEVNRYREHYPSPEHSALTREAEHYIDELNTLLSKLSYIEANRPVSRTP